MVTRETILKKALEMANHNLYCTSADYAMTRPRAGQETDHAEYATEAEILKEWLAELPTMDPKLRFEKDLQDAKDGICEGEIITNRREEIARLQAELAQIEEAAS
jgi:hypothetical protein